jgi:Uncharacterised nucleotidyltransferase
VTTARLLDTGDSRSALPEHRVLLDCARLVVESGARRDASVAAVRASLERVRDWSTLLRAAPAESLLGPLYAAVTAAAPDVVPEDRLTELRKLYRVNTERMLRFTGQLLRILDLLRANGVQAVPFKGPALAEDVFGEVGMRQSVDLDILVTAADVAHACELLAANAFRWMSPESKVPWRELLRNECEAVLVGTDGSPMVELHWRVGPRFDRGSLSAERLIKRAGTISLLGVEVPSLCPQDTALVLALHASTHRWEELEQILTFAVVLAKMTEDELLATVAEAGEQGCRRRFLIGCILARDVLGQDLPKAVEECAAADPAAAQLADRSRTRLFSEDHGASIGGGLPGLRWQAAALDTRPDRIRHLVARVFVPGAGDWDAVHLPRGLRWLYYLVRPLRLMGFLHGRETAS